MTTSTANQFVTLRRDENQARAIGQYALDMLSGRHPGPSDAVLAKTEQFHLDSVACGVSALACGANAPTVLRREALEYRRCRRAAGVPMFGSHGPRRAGEGRARLLVGRARVGLQRHELRLQPGPRRHRRRIRPQRLLSRRRRRRPARRLRRPPNARRDDAARRNPRPARRSLRAEESQDRPRRPRRDRFGRRLRRRTRRERRPDRIGDRPGASPTTFRSAQSAPGISFPIPKAPRPRSAPRSPC